MLAWHHDPGSSASQAQHKRYAQRAREEGLAGAEGLLDEEVAPLHTVVLEQLDSIIRASSLVEMVQAFLRPSLTSCTGQSTQET